MHAADLLTYQQVAAAMGVSIRQVERYVAKKKLRRVDMGHRTKRFRRADVDRAIAKLAGDSDREW